MSDAYTPLLKNPLLYASRTLRRTRTDGRTLAVRFTREGHILLGLEAYGWPYAYPYASMNRTGHRVPYRDPGRTPSDSYVFTIPLSRGKGSGKVGCL